MATTNQSNTSVIEAIDAYQPSDFLRLFNIRNSSLTRREQILLFEMFRMEIFMLTQFQVGCMNFIKNKRYHRRFMSWLTKFNGKLRDWIWFTTGHGGSKNLQLWDTYSTIIVAKACQEAYKYSRTLNFVFGDVKVSPKERCPFKRVQVLISDGEADVNDNANNEEDEMTDLFILRNCYSPWDQEALENRIWLQNFNRSMRRDLNEGKQMKEQMIVLGEFDFDVNVTRSVPVPHSSQFTENEKIFSLKLFDNFGNVNVINVSEELIIGPNCISFFTFSYKESTIKLSLKLSWSIDERSYRKIYPSNDPISALIHGLHTLTPRFQLKLVDIMLDASNLFEVVLVSDTKLRQRTLTLIKQRMAFYLKNDLFSVVIPLIARLLPILAKLPLIFEGCRAQMGTMVGLVATNLSLNRMNIDDEQQNESSDFLWLLMQLLALSLKFLRPFDWNCLQMDDPLMGNFVEALHLIFHGLINIDGLEMLDLVYYWLLREQVIEIDQLDSLIDWQSLAQVVNNVNEDRGKLHRRTFK